MRRIMRLSISVLCIMLFASGCAQQYASLKAQNDLYPAKLDPKAPLVLAIPGLNVPGAIPQQDHFGYLVPMLAEQGIACRILAYDTPEHPLTSVASLGFDKTNIATTRVGPATVDAIQYETARRATLGLPPVKEAVFFSYSQGAVIANRIANGIYLFKEKYRAFSEKYGQEWTALQSDPEFLFLMNALTDFIVLRDMKVQRESDFEKDPDLKSFFERAQKKLDAQAREFMTYLKDPREKYPTIVHFEPLNSAKYPKAYPKLDACAEECFTDLQNFSELKQFFVDYATYKDVLNVHFRFISTAGSYFGSPVANQTYGLMEVLPFLQGFVGPELRQIKDTQLGAPHQTKDAEDLLAMKRENHYPYSPEDALFLLGAHGDQGDGLVDQSAAHLSNHALGFSTLQVKGGPAEERVEMVVDRLPDFTIVPLPTKHFPETTLFGGRAYGAAFMEKGNPVFPYLLDFIRKDWKEIHGKLAESDIHLRQFMVEVFFQKPENTPNPSFSRKDHTKNVRINREITNTGSDTYVWMGNFTGEDQRMNLFAKEDDSGFVTFSFWRDPQRRYTVDIPVYPGCNTLVKMEIQ